MKKFYSLLLFLICTAQLHAQGYYPMLDSISNDWYYISNLIPVRQPAMTPNCDYANTPLFFESNKMFTSGDTLINSLTYKKLEIQHVSISGYDCFFGYLREDTVAQKIYFMDNTFSPEVLLYDFSMQVGDSIYYDFTGTVGYYTPGFYRVDSISTVSIPAGSRRIFYLRNHAVPFPPQYPMEWIESVGHPGHLVFTHSGNSSFGGMFSICYDYLIRDFYQSLSCFEHNSQKVFFDSCAHAYAFNNFCFYYADSCNYWNICGSLEENGLISDFKVIPNPASEEVKLYIEAKRNDKAVLEVYDISGKRVINREIVIRQGINEEPLEADFLEAGSYLVMLKFESGTIYRKLVRTN